jgi:hypothetical protein
VEAGSHSPSSPYHAPGPNSQRRRRALAPGGRVRSIGSEALLLVWYIVPGPVILPRVRGGGWSRRGPCIFDQQRLDEFIFFFGVEPSGVVPCSRARVTAGEEENRECGARRFRRAHDWCTVHVRKLLPGSYPQLAGGRRLRDKHQLDLTSGNETTTWAPLPDGHRGSTRRLRTAYIYLTPRVSPTER